MTAPRRILPGTSYLVTRRCAERRFFLRPDRVLNEIVLYVLALAAERTGVLVHAFCVMSDHVHFVVTDVEGRLPEFMQYLDSLVARAVNAHRGRFEAFWAGAETYSAVEPLAPGDLAAKIAYVLANPVAAGLVRRGSEWPGLWTAPDEVGRARRVARRPDVFFDPKGYLPAQAELALALPPCFDSADELRDAVAPLLRALEEKHEQALVAAGRRFLGAKRVLAQSPFARPATREPRFGMKPRVAARDPWKRIEALARAKDFLRAYREAWAARRAGRADVVFPAGTYLLRIMHGVVCAGAA